MSQDNEPADRSEFQSQAVSVSSAEMPVLHPKQRLGAYLTRVPVLIGIFLFLGLWGYLGYYYGDLLYFGSEFDSLSIPWKGPFKEFCDFSLPASLLTTGGHFLSVLGQIPLLAGAVLAGLFVWFFFLQLRLWSGRRKSWQWFIIFTFVSLFFLIEMVPFHGYSFFDMIQYFRFFSYLIGLIAASVLTLAVRKISIPKKRLIIPLLLGILLYPFFGFFALLTLLWVMLDFETGLLQPVETAVPQKRPAHYYGCRLILLAAVLLVPLLWFPLFSAHYDGSKIYSAGLFAFDDEPSGKRFFSSQVLFPVTMILTTLPVLFNLLRACISSKMSVAPSAPEASKRPLLTENRLFFSCLFLFFTAIFCCSLYEKNFLVMVRSFRPLEEGNWDKILTLEQKIAEPAEPMIGLRQLALLRTGRAANEYFERPNLVYRPSAVLDVGMLDIYGPSLMFYQGIPNFSERLAMEQFVIMENRSPNSAVMLTLSALAKGNSLLAEKYINWLSRQIGWTRRANDFREILDFLKNNGWLNPAQQITPKFLEAFHQNGPQERVSFWAEEIFRCRLLKSKSIILGSSNVASAFAGPVVLEQNWTGYPLEWLEIQLIFAMQTANLDRFNELFPSYYSRWQKERTGQPIPKMLQEGAMFVEFIETQQFPPKKYSYDPALLNRFQALLTVSGNPEGPGPEFNDTWWKYLFEWKKQTQNSQPQ